MNPIVVCTRFTNGTWGENCRWRERRGHTGCAYGSPIEVSAGIPALTPIYVIELNIESNRVEGVGMIRKTPPISTLEEPSARIYRCQHFSRYAYLGKVRVDRSDWLWDQCEMIWRLEEQLVKGSRHLKRGLGFTKLPDRIMKNKELRVLRTLHGMFAPPLAPPAAANPGDGGPDLSGDGARVLIRPHTQVPEVG